MGPTLCCPLFRGQIRRIARIARAATFAFLLVCAPVVTGFAQDITVLKGNHPIEAETLGPVGRADANRSLTMSITFALRNRAALGRLLSELQDPTSPQFHNWLSPAEFNRRFGPRDADVTAVVDWLGTEGFTGISVNRAGHSVSFSGTVAQAERTFTVSIATFGKGQVFANTNDPVIPARFADVITGIHGLDNMLRAVPAKHGSPRPAPLPAPMSRKSHPLQLALAGSQHPSSPDASDQGTEPDVKINGQDFFGPNDLRTFYNINPLLTSGTDGSGDCFAIVGDSDFLASAVNGFNTFFGLPASTINTILVDGTNPGKNDSETEALLDLESSHTVAPGATQNFYLGDDNHAIFTGSSIVDAIQRAVTDNSCSVISVSFGLCGNPASFIVNTVHPIYAQAAAQGQSIFISSGDQGSAGLVFDPNQNKCLPGSTASVNELGADSNLTSIGGTEFTPNYDTSGNDVGFTTEFVWNDASGATGGGVSQDFTKPTYQNGVNPADGQRDVPDVAMIGGGPGLFMEADNSGSPALIIVDGTSLATPVFAGIAKLIGQKAGQRLGNMNPRIYQLAAAQELGGAGAPDNGFRDVTSGNNGFNGVSGFAAGPGFDLSTGWGSVDAAAFADAFTTASTPPPVPVPLKVSPSIVRFGVVRLGSVSKPKKITLRNPNKQGIPITLQQLQTTKDFRFPSTGATTCLQTLPAKGKCFVFVLFAPSGVGPDFGTLTIPDNAKNAPQTIRLKGRGK